MRLPSLNALRAFEAAARHGGFTGAASELCVTRGAVSRYVKLLEQELGVTLLRRLAHGIELTSAGRSLLPVLTSAFEIIQRQVQQIASEGNDLRVVCPPTLSIRWLIPRLDQFRELHPNIRIRLTIRFFVWRELLGGEFDLGIGCDPSSEPPKGIEVVPLFPMIIVPACAPALLAGPVVLKEPPDLVGFTLLHESPDHHDWQAWLTAFDVQGVDPRSGADFPNLDMAVRAAVLGEGIVMGDVVLTREEFEAGQLVMPFAQMKCATDWGDFALCGPASQWDDPKVEAFRSWIADVAADDVDYCVEQMKA